MSEFDDLISAGLQEFESKVPATIKIDGQTLAGVFSDLSLQDAAEMFGSVESADAIFLLRKALYSSRPADQKKVQIGSQFFKIESVVDDGPVWHINLRGASR